MRLVFIGSSAFGLKCLQACLEISEVKVVGVVSGAKTFKISYRPQGVTNVLHADLAGLAVANNIPAVTIERSMADPLILETVTAWKPDAFLVAGWYHMIPKNWRNLSPAYGLHASLLPDYSGGAPLVWAMINGETKTGITFFQMDDGVDSGPIVGQVEEMILDSDTIETLYARIEERGLELLRAELHKLAFGTASFKPQDESRRRIFSQRSPLDGRINWLWDAHRIRNFVRAQTSPYPGAYTYFGSRKVNIWSVSISHRDLLLRPGRIAVRESQLYVGCGSPISLKLEIVGEEGRELPAINWWAQMDSKENHEKFTN